MIYDRKSKEIINDSQYGGKYLDFLYNKAIGRMLLKFIICPVFSKINGIYNSTSASRSKINGFIKEYGIDMSGYEKKQYSSFNDFFTRKRINICFDRNEKAFISPADSKLTVYRITDDMKVKVKQSIYTINELVGEKSGLEKFSGGNCLVFRLSMDDYHRYCFIDDGEVIKHRYIKGKLHTVSSVSSKCKVYSHNTRVCDYMDTRNFGRVIFIEVGALLVGKINDRKKRKFSKGEEKGYFELGGSTIVILTNDAVKIDDDILHQSKKGIETKVKYGEKIGEIKW